MGIKVHCKSYLPGFYSMRDLNENYSSGSWPVYYGDKMVPNGQYYNGFMPRTLVDGYPEHDKDTLKQKMLEHEAVFKNQVCELHRLYRIQRDMMEEVKRKDVHNHRASMEPASSSSHHGSQVPLDDSRKWHMAGFPLLNSSYGRTPIVGVENLSSPISCTKEIITQPGQSPFWSTSKVSEAIDSRPSKVRKKLFDLQLPADQYVDPDDEENLHEYKECDTSSYAKTDGQMDASASTSRLMGSTVLADLNEPIHIEEEMGPSSVDFLGRTLENVETRDVHRPFKMTSGYLCLTGDAMLVRDGFSMNSSGESQVNEKGWFSHLSKAGSSRSNLSSVMQGSYAGKYTYPNGYSREDLWREGFRHGPESSRSYDHFNNSHFEPMASKNPGSYPFFSSSSFASSWAHPVSSWAKPTSNGFHHSSASGSKEPQVQPQSAGFDQLNCSRVDNIASDRSTKHGFANFPKGSYADPKPVIDLNLNEALPESPLNETVIPHDVITADGTGKPQENLQTLPWLKPKPIHVNKVSSTSRSDASSNQLSCKNGTLGVALTSCDSEIPRRQETKKILGVPIVERDVSDNGPSSHESKIVSNERKNGMIDINVACELEEEMGNEELTLKNESPKKGLDVKNLIDLNSCLSDYEDPPYEQKSSSIKITMEIDLEAPVCLESEDDNTLFKEKMPEEALSESLENKHDQKQDEDVLTNAVETLVSISSCPKTDIEDCVCLPTESSVEEALLWFVDAVGKESKTLETSEEMDDFEAMTLQLAETREEDYMPKPFVPEFSETGQNALTTRTRRGHSRRGRQRRDFQRDILPGLTSLSRHEVTEDLQTFGGLMRATGHSWSSGLARRNGGGRGRRRAVVETSPPAIVGPVCAPLIKQLSVVEPGLEDRSLTGWGKTTRRPRRQRCPAGNPPTVVLM